MPDVRQFIGCQMLDTFLGLLTTFWSIVNDNELFCMDKTKAPFPNVGKFCKDGFQPCGEYQSKT